MALFMAAFLPPLFFFSLLLSCYLEGAASFYFLQHNGVTWSS